jgi:hypothetical protein
LSPHSACQRFHGCGGGHPTPALCTEAFSQREIVKFTDLSQEIEPLKKGRFLTYRKQIAHWPGKMNFHCEEKPLES